MTDENIDEKQLSRTAKATEARKTQAAQKRAESQIVKRYGEFLPSNTIDPLGVYKLWKKSIFGDDKGDDTTMFFVVSQAKAAGIDARIPRQIYAIPYELNKKNDEGKWYKEKKYTVIIGIDGLVSIAERTGMYGGLTQAKYEFGTIMTEDGFGEPDYSKIISCTVGVHKVVQGVLTTSYATAYFDEYDTGKNLWKPVDATKEKDEYIDGKKTGRKINVPDGGKPKTMIAKVATAMALRRAFSACAGLYVAEEVEQKYPDALDGEVTPDLEAQIASCTTRQEIAELQAQLSVEDKKRAAPHIEKKLAEL